MEVPLREDLGMVWMNDIIMQNDNREMMLGRRAVQSAFFQDAGHSLNDEMQCSSQGVDGFALLEDLQENGRWCVNGITPDDMLVDEPLMLKDEEELIESADSVINVAKGFVGDIQQFSGHATTASSSANASKKIKPIKHPALKLQTPIAYQRDTDLNVIPIQKEGRAVCQKCGAIGVKHSFYTRERRYCSLACARGSADILPNHSPTDQQDPEYISPSVEVRSPFSPSVTPDQWPPAFATPIDDAPPFPPDRKRLPYEMQSSYDWSAQLECAGFRAAPVTCFKHAPMADQWDYIMVGLKVEVENTDSFEYKDHFANVYWVATVMRIEGYKALLRYEGYLADNSKDFWVNICSSSIHPVGWCAVRGIPLIPPDSIKGKYSNWKEFLKRRLSGARTLPSSFFTKVIDSMKSRFRKDLIVEVMDKERISQVKVATIESIVGKRLRLRYYDSKPNTADRELFWCHEDSPLVHPVGWAHRVGHALDATPEYYDRVAKGLRQRNDATAELFAPMPELSSGFFQAGMKLEAVDPLNLGDICAATVMQVLNDGYLMICVDYYAEPSTSQDWFCYHMSSPSIFPAGFCSSNGIRLTPPKGYANDTFDWQHYLRQTGCVSAPAHLFNLEVPDHNFVVGMKMEAADLMNPRLVCVATVVRVVGHLLRVHFDGWENDFDQWVYSRSCDIYPVGWCELVSHKLEPPYHQPPVVINSTTITDGMHATISNENGVMASSPVLLKDDLQLPNSVLSKSDPQLADEFIDFSQLSSTSSIQPDIFNQTTFVQPVEQLEFGGGSDEMEPVEKSNDPLDEETLAFYEQNDNHNLPEFGSLADNIQLAKTKSEKLPILKKMIPKLVGTKNQNRTFTNLEPVGWNVQEVAEFLELNDCSAYCNSFKEKEINGKKLLELTKEEVHSLVGMKVGPSLKIQNLINQLVSKTNYHRQSKKVTSMGRL